MSKGDNVEDDMVSMLSKTNTEMRQAGCELAEAAMRVIRNHDGLHRLSLAVSKWATVIANENGRGEMYGSQKE